MAELLLELFSEEIPARMQTQAARDLERLARERLQAADLTFSRLETFAGPRRLTLVADGLPLRQADRLESRRGPKVDAPVQAVEGFLRSTGLERDQLIVQDGAFWAEALKPGRPTGLVAGEMVEAILASFPWPKSMRWADGSFRWVRPLKRILCLFDGAVAPVVAAGLSSGAQTEGHRFMGRWRGPVAVADFASYRAALDEGCVVLEIAERRRRIKDGAAGVCAARGLELVPDDGLLEELCGLAEWPVPVMGEMDPVFLALPPEVIRTSMRTHQKYFAVRDPHSGRLAPFFVLVANIEAADGGRRIADGNAKVLSARLKDADFFWREDLKTPLERRLERLKGVTFHARLGAVFDRVGRIEAIARRIALMLGCDATLAGTAARLCKADLVCGMVGEFPELQGVMGGYYARAEGLAALAAGAADAPAPPGEGPTWTAGLTTAEIDAVADAVRDHYKPLGPSEAAPTAPVTMAVALADKLDLLISFFSIDEKPTGSRDPYALRRAALGVIRIILASKAKLPLKALLRFAADAGDGSPADQDRREAATSAVLMFLGERLKVMLRDEGKRHDLVDAVFALAGDDLVAVTTRVDALSDFLDTPDGLSLLAGYRRAVNILKAEDRKGRDAAPDPGGAPSPPAEEAALDAAVQAFAVEGRRALAGEDVLSALQALSRLRAPVDAFFDKVLVNDEDERVRFRRLQLLTQVRDEANRIADFSLVSG